MQDWSGSSNPKFKDGRSSHPLWGLYWMMRTRCENPRFPSYPRYGGRGITVCDRWRDFAAFAADMGERPPGMTLERCDNDKGYEPSNCRWATHTEQMRNRSNNVYVTLAGVTMLRSDWCAELGVHESKIRSRVRRGMSYQEAFQ